MTFASPAWLLLLLLGPLIAFLHSRPRRNLEVSSLSLWRHAVSGVPPRASRKMPEPNLLMLLQVLVVILIALALSRPMLSGRIAEIDHWIVLVDASGGMDAQAENGTRFAEAREYLTRELRQADGMVGRLSLLSVDGRPSIVAARLARPEQVLEALAEMVPSHSSADWHTAAALLPGLQREGERTRVTVLTHPAGSAEARSIVSSAAQDVEEEVYAFGRPVANRSLAGVTPILVDAERGMWRISGEVRAGAVGDVALPASSITLRVLFEPAGAAGALEWATREIELDETGMTPFDLDVSIPGPGLLEVRLPQDDLPHDDGSHFVLHGAPAQARVLYVGAGNVPLELALEAVPGVVLTRAAALPEPAAADHDLVILEGVVPSRRPGTNAVWLGVAPDEGEMSPLAEPAPTGWLDEHPLSRSVDWSALSVRSARGATLLPGAEMVLEASGLPLVQARTTAQGREVVIAFDLTDTDWPELLAFPAFVTNLVRWAVPDVGSAVAAPCHAGLPCPVRPAELSGGSRIVGPGPADLALPSFYHGGDDLAEDEAWLPRAAEAVFVPRRRGVYTVESDGQRRSIAVNAAYSAGSERLPEGDDSAGPAPAEPPGRGPLALREWLLILAIIALCAEGWIAGRTTERFLRWEGLVRGNPLAGRRRVILGLRASALALLILALMDVQGIQPQRRADTVLVIDDVSARGEEVREVADAVLATAAEDRSRARRFGSVRIGPEGRVTGDVGAEPGHARQERPDLPGADLEAALGLAGAMLPRESTGRIVLVSDGGETRGNVVGALPTLLDRRIPVDVYLLPGPGADDVSVDEVVLPRMVHHNEVARLQAIVSSSRRTAGTLRLWREGVLDSERTVDLHPGRNRIEFEIVEEEPGAYLYEVAIEVEGDDFPANDRNGLLVDVRTPPRIVIVTPQPTWGRSLADALDLQGVTADVMTPDQAPRAGDSDGSDRAAWSDFDVVTLMNVPASDLSTGQMEELEDWVRGSGGGLIVMGGENTFGPGGYFDTPLEELSPLSARIPQELPNLAIVFVLDRSGSMAQTVGGGTRLDVAKLATLEAVELLDPETQVAVVAFDINAVVVVPFQPAGDIETFRVRLEQLRTGGGTRIYPGLALAYSHLYQIDPDFRRHIVLMSDGQSREGDFRSLMGAIVDAGMTLSTAAIGRGADALQLEQLARMGGGAAHATTDFDELPSILAREATRFSSGPVRNEPLTPAWRSREATFVQSFPDSPPTLQGFVRTTAKPGARVHLAGGDDVPLLASWRYGLGRVVAFASHGAGPWAAEWMAAPDYALWWSQTVRWTLPGAAGPGLNLQITRDGDVARVVVEALRPNGGTIVGLELDATIAAPDDAAPVSTRLREAEPGTYVATFIADRAGTYSVTVSPPSGPHEFPLEVTESRLHVGYPARFQPGRSDGGMLLTLARVTGGRVLTGNDRILDERLPLRWVGRSMWPFWASLALALFVVELLRRYGSALPRLGLRPRPPDR
jgi:uncharacterized protein YegL